jgi:pimeloyl-ACP methyl ester carboxylesterase
MRIAVASGCDEITADDGTRLRFHEAGSGPTSVVLLHGLFGSPSNWLLTMDALADSCRCFALQLPIDYQKDRRHTAFKSLGQLTDHVSSFMEAMSLDRAVLCGNSLGGQVALHYCLCHPQRVERLVLSGSAGLYERSLSGGRMPRVCRNFIRAQACGIFHDPVHVSDELVDDVYQMLSDRHYRRFLLRVAMATREQNMLDDLAKIQVPTLIVWGRDDLITPPSVAEEFRRHIKSAELTFIDACGHAPPIEQPQQFAQILHTFLRDTPPRGRMPCKPR